MNIEAGLFISLMVAEPSLDEVAFTAHDIRALSEVEANAATVASLAVDVPDYLGTQEFLVMIEVQMLVTDHSFPATRTGAPVGLVVRDGMNHRPYPR